MSDISKRALSLFESLGISYADLAKVTGIPKSALQRYLVGETDKIPIDRLQSIATALGTSAEHLLGWDTGSDVSTLPAIPPDALPITRRKIPILSAVQCGEPRFAEETFEGYAEAKCDIPVDYALYAHGDSMINAGIRDGDIVFVRRQTTVDNGTIAVVLIGDETTLKRVYRFPTELRLVPDNPAYRTMVYSGAELADIRILGRCMFVQHVLN